MGKKKFSSCWAIAGASVSKMGAEPGVVSLNNPQEFEARSVVRSKMAYL